MKLTNEQTAAFDKARLDYLNLLDRLYDAKNAEIAEEKKEAEEKTESALFMSILALLGTAILSGFFFKVMLNLGAAKFILLLLAIVGVGALVLSVKQVLYFGFERKAEEEIVEGEPIDEEELD